MSRIGKKPVVLPSGVTATVSDASVTVKGPKGDLSLAIPARVTVASITLEDGGSALSVEVTDDNLDRAIWGTVRALLQNMVKGVTEGWSKTLELTGVGYKMNLQGNKLVLSLGFSHDVDYPMPEGIKAELKDNTLTISGADRQMVGQTAAKIRSLKKPEPYKGKGFKYNDEVIRRKLGKAAKSE